MRDSSSVKGTERTVTPDLEKEVAEFAPRPATAAEGTPSSAGKPRGEAGVGEKEQPLGQLKLRPVVRGEAGSNYSCI